MFTIKIVIEDSNNNSASTFSISNDDVNEVSVNAIDFIKRVTTERLGVCYRLKVREIPGGDYLQNNRIKAIKGIRTVTGLGLKEAKDAVDSVTSGISVILPTVFDSPKSIEMAKIVLFQSGFNSELIAI